MTYAEKKVLVTGAGGFIGSHLTEALVASGANVRAFVHYNSRGTWGWLDTSHAKSNFEVVSGDITDTDSVRSAAKGVDYIFHLAALIAIPYSYQSPRAYIDTNIQGTLNVLHAARDQNITRVVHTSTSEVYGTAVRVPIDETHPLQGQSPYSATKIGADMLVDSFNRSFGLPTVTVRPFNTFGPRQSARAIIPTIISQCLAGDKVRIGSTTPTRDLNYVDNTVAGFMAAGLSDAALGKAINFGSGREISIGELLALIMKLMSVDLDVVEDQDRRRPANSEVERLVADSRLATQLTGWTPTISLEQGLIQTINWLTANMAWYRPETYQV